VFPVAAHGERSGGKLDRPEQPREWDPTVVVVDLRARPGREQVDSHLRECPLVWRAVLPDVLPLKDPHVRLEVVR
jgi:hypothetical protein